MADPVWSDKVWGKTRCVYESSQFSGHWLVVKAGGYSSVHYHCDRANRFIVDSGKIAVVEFYAWRIKRQILRKGQQLDIPSLVPHQFQVLEDGIIREEYWADRGGEVEHDDIVRLCKGGMVDTSLLEGLAKSKLGFEAASYDA